LCFRRLCASIPGLVCIPARKVWASHARGHRERPDRAESCGERAWLANATLLHWSAHAAGRFRRSTSHLTQIGLKRRTGQRQWRVLMRWASPQIVAHAFLIAIHGAASVDVGIDYFPLRMYDVPARERPGSTVRSISACPNVSIAPPAGASACRDPRIDGTDSRRRRVISIGCRRAVAGCCGSIGAHATGGA
jgi:hypothetical protein